MFVAELTPHGQSVVSTHVTIDGIILLSESLSNIGSSTISSYNALLDIEACGNINNSIGYVKIEDGSESIYQARTILFYMLSGSTKNIIAGCSKSIHIVNKTQSALDIQIPVDFSCFTNGFTFSSIQSGYHTASDSIAGIVHIDDPTIVSDDSYSVYSKTQVDELISNIGSYDIPTNISAFNNDVGYISQIKTINNQSLVGTGDITIKAGSNYATYVGDSPENFVAYSNNISLNGKALLPYGDAANSAGYVDLGSYENRWRNAYIKDAIYLSDRFVSIKSSTNLLRLTTANSSNQWTSVITDITDTHFNVNSYVGSSAADRTVYYLINANSDGISLYDNYLNITSTEIIFNKDIDLVLAKDTNTYITSNILASSSSLTVSVEFTDIDFVGGLKISLNSDIELWSKIIPLSELDTVTPIGELEYVYDDMGYSYYSVSQTDVTESLKSMFDNRYWTIEQSGLYIDGDIDDPTSLGVFCSIYSYSTNPVLYVIPVSELLLDNYVYSERQGLTIVFNNNSVYTTSNDYYCNLAVQAKLSIYDYVEKNTSGYCTLSTDQTITGNKTFNSSVYIPTTSSRNLYVTGYSDGAGIRFGDSASSSAYPMIVGETMSSTRCDLRQNYYINNTLTGTIQTECNSDGTLITTSGLGRSSSTTGKWSLGTSDYHLNSVYADNFHGNFHGNFQGNGSVNCLAYSDESSITPLLTASSSSEITVKSGTILGSAGYDMFGDIYTQCINTSYIGDHKYGENVVRVDYGPSQTPDYIATYTISPAGTPSSSSVYSLGSSGRPFSKVYSSGFIGNFPRGTCSTSASDAAKTVTVSPSIDTSSLKDGLIINVYFSTGNTASSPTLNVNGTGAVPLRLRHNVAMGNTSDKSWNQYDEKLLVYCSGYWCLLNYISVEAVSADILPSINSTSISTGYDLGSPDLRWKSLYISGGNSSHYIVIDNSGSEPTIRPDTSNYGYLGSSSYHWYRSYINTLYLGSSAVQIPPISAKSNTTLGSIQFLRVAIPANTTTGIVNAGTVLSSSSYTLMLVTASTGATYLSFRNNTAPSGSWTTLTDMYFYNSTTSVVYTYVLAYKSA